MCSIKVAVTESLKLQVGLGPDTPTMLRNGGHNAATKFFSVVVYGLMISKKKIHLDSSKLEREAYFRWLSKPRI